MTSPVLRTAVLDSSPGPGNHKSPRRSVSRIVLDLTGGSKGLLVNSESLCDAAKRAMVRMTGQNGVTSEGKTKLQTSCGSKVSHRRHHKGHHAPRTTVR
jgi:hypothetical protein